MDWYGNPVAADTEKEDEERYRQMLILLGRQSSWEIVDAEHADPGSIVNGGSGWPTLKREMKW